MRNIPIRPSYYLAGRFGVSVATVPRHSFHDYFVTHLPSSSAHPDSRPALPHHKLPRNESTPHDPKTSSRPAAVSPIASSRELTVVRIPLKSAKHHYGAFSARGQRPYNEDTFQAGTIELPAFAMKRPKSLSLNNSFGEAPNAASSTGDPQVFYFGVFDGHGGNVCSDFLRDHLHEYLEDAGKQFGLQSSLKGVPEDDIDEFEAMEEVGLAETPKEKEGRIVHLERSVLRSWKELVGGYFKRFKPDFFTARGGGQGKSLAPRKLQNNVMVDLPPREVEDLASIEAVIQWAFLKADYDFIASQVAKGDGPEENQSINEALSRSAAVKQIGGPERFLGGSTCSIALISTPTPMPFWNPRATCTLMTAHCGDTRILLCNTANGDAIGLTSTHHPDDPVEARRMRRFSASFATDSFGEERVGGLANTRAFGDMPSKRVGVSAEPEIVRLEVEAAQFSFMVLMSDGISGQLSDQEICDIIKEAKTPEQGAKDVVGYATEVSTDGDNATVMVVRLGGWERRNEGGHGSLRTKEEREFRRKEALDPRSRQR